jgi:hypothetical protein
VDAVDRRALHCRCVFTLDTTTLRNGKHLRSARVIYSDRRSSAIHKTIVVRNKAARRPAPARAAGMNVGAFGPPTHGVRRRSVAQFNRETYYYRTTWSMSQEANRYQFMVLSGNEYAEIPLLKAFNPNLKFLVYQAIMFTKSTDFSWMQTVTGCTPYADDAANHPSWILHDQNGNPVIAPNQTALYATDVGNPDYQRACAANAVALAKRYGFDGVFFDVVEGNLRYTLRPGVTVPEYPNNVAWQTAMNSALAYLGPALRAQGLLVFGNIGEAASTAQWEQWVGHLDGVEEESWTDGGSGLAQQIPWWSQKLVELSWAMANGKYEFVHSYNTAEAPNTYGLASMLLAANGRASYSTTNGATSDEYWFPEYDTARQLGAPAGPYAMLANGVYERAFANGIVLVNPSTRSIPNFWLGGDRYSTSGNLNVRAIAMPPTSGDILLEAG